MSNSPSDDDTLSTKERIAEIAAALFAEHGVASTSIRMICHEARITAPTLYYHFGSKDGLLRHIVFPTLESFLGDVAELPQGSSLHDRLLTLAERVLAFGETRPASVRLIAQLDTMPLAEDDQQRTTELQSKSMASIAGLFQQGVEAGELPVVDPLYGAMSFVGLIMFHMAARQQVSEEVRPPIDEAAAQLVRFVLAGMRGLASNGSASG